MKATYNIILGEESAGYGDLFAEVWNLKILPSTQITAWRVVSKAIATKDNLLRCGVSPVCDRCPLCGVLEETVSRLLLFCVGSLGEFGDCLEWLRISSVLHCDAQMHFKMFKPIGLKHVFAKCWGDLGRYYRWNLESYE